MAPTFLSKTFGHSSWPCLPFHPSNSEHDWDNASIECAITCPSSSCQQPVAASSNHDSTIVAQTSETISKGPKECLNQKNVPIRPAQPRECPMSSLGCPNRSGRTSERLNRMHRPEYPMDQIDSPNRHFTELDIQTSFHYNYRPDENDTDPSINKVLIKKSCIVPNCIVPNNGGGVERSKKSKYCPNLPLLFYRSFPIFETLSSYRRSDLFGDLAAGIAVGVTSVPMG